MPSTRRVKILATALIIAVLTIIYLSVWPWTSGFDLEDVLTTHSMKRDSSSQEFYSRTVAALEKQASDAETARRLQEVKDTASNQGPVVAPAPHKPLGDSVSKDRSHIGIKVSDQSYPEKGPPDGSMPEKDMVGRPAMNRESESEKSVAGRKTMKGGEIKDLHSGNQSPMERSGEAQNDEKKEEKSKEDQEVDLELNSILKKGPSTHLRSSSNPLSMTLLAQL